MKLAFSPDSNWQREFEDAFEFTETKDQLTAAQEIKRDMESPQPMDRLLCGDVGFGKTEVVMRAAFKALGDGKPLVIDATSKPWTEWQTRFDKALANPPREPEVGHSPTVKAALFLMNDATVLDWIKPDGENLAARLATETDPAKLADELYLAVLSRMPHNDERQQVAEFLAAQSDRREKAIGSLIWSLVASNEFCANH